MILLAIDPGKNAGWALFAGGERTAPPANLVACGLDKTVSLHCAADIVIIEKPQVYRTRKSKGDPNDLIPVAIQVGRYQERALVAGAEVELVLPAEWKVQLSKEICATRILKALSPTERKIVDAVKCAASLKHNVLDAIGIGLFKLGRGGGVTEPVHVGQQHWDGSCPGGCDYWWGRLCMCNGVCSCHWTNKGAEESMSTAAPSTITAAMVPVPAEAEAELVAEATKVAKAVVLLQAFEIKTSEDMELAGERVKIVKEWWNTIENRRTEMTQPINAGLRSINAFFKPLLDPLKNAEMTLKSKIAAYTLAVRAEQEKAMQAAATAAAAGNTAAAAQHVAALAPQAPVQGVSVREVWDWEVVDEAAVPRQYLSIDPAKVKAVIETNPIYGLVPNIPGLRIFKKGSVTVRQK